jgi:hypothetical protein
MLRALILKAAGIARTAWAKTRLTVTTAIRIPKAVATAGLGFLASDTGYRAVVKAMSTFVRMTSRAVGTILRLAGRTVSRLANTTVQIIGRVSPKVEAWLRRITRILFRPVKEATAWAGAC